MLPKNLKLVPSDKYSRRWKKAKAKFKKDTGEKYPTTTKPVTAFGATITTKREGLGIEKALKAIESLAPGATKSPGNMQKLNTAVGHYGQVHARYILELDRLITNAPAGINKSAHKRGWRHLKSELEDINFAVRDEYKKAQVLRGENAILAKQARKVVRYAYKNAEAARLWIDQLRLNPTAAAFNQDIQDKARNITQHIGNIDRYKYFGFDIQRDQPQQFVDRLNTWGSGTRKLDLNASAQEIGWEIEEFESAVLWVREWAK